MTDPRIRQLAKRRQDMAHESGSGLNPSWDQLSPQDQKVLLGEAAEWLRAAVEAGIAPLADRPTDKHDAVYVDDEGLLYAEYRTMPESDCILRLVWADRMAERKSDLEDRGATFQLLGWCL